MMQQFLLLSILPGHLNIIDPFENMENAKTFNISEAVLNIIAVVLTVSDILFRGSVLLFKKTISLFFQLICILMLTAAIILAYLIVMAISTAVGPWLNTHIQ